MGNDERGRLTSCFLARFFFCFERVSLRSSLSSSAANSASKLLEHVFGDAATEGKAGLEGPNCASTGSEAFEVGIYAE